MLIDTLYFKTTIKFPSDDVSIINAYAEQSEKDYLIKCLGYTLYKEFIEGIAETSPAQKWIDLRDGKEYEVVANGEIHTVKWNGLINDDKISLLSYFTYFFLSRYMSKTATLNGTVANEQENGNLVSAKNLQVNAWNDAIDLYGNDIYNKFQISSELVTTENILKPTLYNFIYHANDLINGTYAKWQFKELEKINMLGV